MLPPKPIITLAIIFGILCMDIIYHWWLNGAAATVVAF